jgi:hypothetical protein
LQDVFKEIAGSGGRATSQFNELTDEPEKQLESNSEMHNALEGLSEAVQQGCFLKK